MFTLPASGRIRSTTLPAAAAVVSLLAATPQVAAHTGQKLVTCTVSTTPGRPITLDPPVSMTVRRITARYNSISDPRYVASARRVNSKNSAVAQKESRPLTVYEPDVLTIRLPDGKMMLMNQ